MPSTSTKQKNFFRAVMGAKEKGEGSPKVKKVAKKMTKKSIQHFLESAKFEDKQKLLKVLKELHSYLTPQDTNLLNEEEGINPIANTFKQNANFSDYVQKFAGIKLAPKEQEAISNYDKLKPTQGNDFSIKYESTDAFGFNTTTIIKKLKEGNQFVFIAFQKHSKLENNNNDETTNEIIVNKSISFKNDIEGGEVLSEFLLKLDI